MKIVKIILVIIGLFCITTVIFALTARDQWWIRAFDYPRLQLTILSSVVLGLSVFVLNWRKLWVWIYGGTLALAVLYQGYILSPYLLPVTPTAPNHTENVDLSHQFSLLVANILMENRDAQSFLDLVKTHDPDLILVMEPDAWWIEQLKPLREQYPHYHEQPQPNHYGLGLYSRFPLENTQIHYFEATDTPAIQTTLRLSAASTVLFYGLHPRPPLPENSVQAADKELIKVAKRINQANIPVVVAGDFNDVPWSFTVEKFQEISQLRDIRIGRGLYNTFDAKNPVLRLPLDHVFISPGLGLVDLSDPLKFSADHFALHVTLVVDQNIR